MMRLLFIGAFVLLWNSVVLAFTINVDGYDLSFSMISGEANIRLDDCAWNSEHGISPSGKLTLPEYVEQEGQVYSLKSIGSYALGVNNTVLSEPEFYTEVKHLTIPASVSSIDGNAFYASQGMQVVVFLGVNGSGSYYNKFSQSLFTVGEQTHDFNTDTVDGVETGYGIYCANGKSYWNDWSFDGGYAVELLPQYELDGVTYELLPTNVARVIDVDETLTGDFVLPDSVIYPAESTANKDRYAVTTIGDAAFFDCKALSSVKLGRYVESIGERSFAFDDNTEGVMTTLYIPQGLEAIGKDAFENNRTLSTVTYYDDEYPIDPSRQKLFFIGESAFENGYALNNESVATLLGGDAIVALGTSAFENCDGLTGDFVISETIKCMGDTVFMGCDNITNLTFNAQLASAGKGIFRGCPKLASATFSKPLATLPNAFFRECSALTTISFANTATDPFVLDQYALSETAIVDLNFLPASTTQIGEYAFARCPNLSDTSALVDSDVTQIDRYAFIACTGLSTFTMQKKLTSLGNRPFHQCVNLEEVSFAGVGDDFDTIPDNCFSGCESLKTIYLGYKIRAIGDSAFEETGITNTDWLAYAHEDGITIGDNAFKNCDQLTRVAISKDIKSLGEYVFTECNNLETVSLGSSTLTSIPERAFSYTPKLRIVEFSPTITSIGDYAFYRSGIQSFTGNFAADGVSLGEGVFYYASRVNSLNILSGLKLTEIPSNTFKCAPLETVEIPEGVISIGASAFSDCKKEEDDESIDTLTSVTLPSSLESIGSSAFAGNEEITEIVFGKKLSTLGDSAFSNCKKLARFKFHPDAPLTTLPSSLFGSTVIPELVKFDGAADGTYNAIPPKVYNLDGNVFYNCRELTSVYIPKNITTYDYSPFYGCLNLEAVTIGEGTVTFAQPSSSSYADGMFDGCRNLTDVIIESDDLTTLADYAFANTGIRSLDFLNADSQGRTFKIESVGSCAFKGCEKLVSADLSKVSTRENGLTFGSYAFSNCEMLKSIVIPETMTEIPERMFSGCNTLESVLFPESLTTIGEYAFYETENLKKIRFYGNLTSIGYAAFYNSGVSDVYFSEALPTFGSNAFDSLYASDDSEKKSFYPGMTYNSMMGRYEPSNEWEGVDEIGDLVRNEKTSGFHLFANSKFTNYISSGHISLAGHPISQLDGKDRYFTTFGNKLYYETGEGIYVCPPYTYFTDEEYDYSLAESLASKKLIVDTIGAGAFSNLENATVVVPKNITTIEANAFYDNRYTTDIVFEGNMPAISATAFNELSTFRDANIVIHYPAGNETWSEIGETLAGCEVRPSVKITKAGIHYELMADVAIVTGYMAAAFPDNEIVIPETITYSDEYTQTTNKSYTVISIAESAFAGQHRTPSLTVTVPRTVALINESACTDVLTLNIPEYSIHSDIIDVNGSVENAYFTSDNIFGGNALLKMKKGHFDEWLSIANAIEIYDQTVIHGYVQGDPAESEIVTIDGLEYTIDKASYLDSRSEDGSIISANSRCATLQGYAPASSRDSSILEVPAEITVYGETYAVKNISPYAFSNLQSVILPETISIIGKNAFSGNTMVYARGHVDTTWFQSGKNRLTLFASQGWTPENVKTNALGFENITFLTENQEFDIFTYINPVKTSSRVHIYDTRYTTGTPLDNNEGETYQLEEFCNHEDSWGSAENMRGWFFSATPAEDEMPLDNYNTYVDGNQTTIYGLLLKEGTTDKILNHPDNEKALAFNLSNAAAIYSGYINKEDRLDPYGYNEVRLVYRADEILPEELDQFSNVLSLGDESISTTVTGPGLLSYKKSDGNTFTLDHLYEISEANASKILEAKNLVIPAGEHTLTWTSGYIGEIKWIEGLPEGMGFSHKSNDVHGGVSITGYNSRQWGFDAPFIEIPESIEGLPVTYIAAEAFARPDFTTPPSRDGHGGGEHWMESPLYSKSEINAPESGDEPSAELDGKFGIVSLTLPASLKEIEADAFIGNPDLATVAFKGDKPIIGENAFKVNSYMGGMLIEGPLMATEQCFIYGFYPQGNDTWQDDLVDESMILRASSDVAKKPRLINFEMSPSSGDNMRVNADFTPTKIYYAEGSALGYLPAYPSCGMRVDWYLSSDFSEASKIDHATILNLSQYDDNEPIVAYPKSCYEAARPEDTHSFVVLNDEAIIINTFREMWAYDELYGAMYINDETLVFPETLGGKPVVAIQGDVFSIANKWSLPASLRSIAPMAFTYNPFLASITVDEENPTIFVENNALYSRVENTPFTPAPTPTLIRKLTFKRDLLPNPETFSVREDTQVIDDLAFAFLLPIDFGLPEEFTEGIPEMNFKLDRYACVEFGESVTSVGSKTFLAMGTAWENPCQPFAIVCHGDRPQIGSPYLGEDDALGDINTKIFYNRATAGWTDGSYTGIYANAFYPYNSGSTINCVNYVTPDNMYINGRNFDYFASGEAYNALPLVEKDGRPVKWYGEENLAGAEIKHTSLHDGRESIYATVAYEGLPSVENMYEFSIVNGQAIVTDSCDESEILTLPATLYGCPVTFSENFSLDSDDIRIVQVPAGVGFSAENVRNLYSLEQIVVSPEHATLASEDGVLFDKAKETLLYYPKAKQDLSYIIPGSVAEIRSDAFRETKNLTAVTIPASVQTIRKNAFSACNELSYILFKSLVRPQNIENNAFDLWDSVIAFIYESAENWILNEWYWIETIERKPDDSNFVLVRLDPQAAVIEETYGFAVAGDTYSQMYVEKNVAGELPAYRESDRSDATFDGWAEKPTANLDKVTSSTLIPTDQPINTLYAQWQSTLAFNTALDNSSLEFSAKGNWEIEHEDEAEYAVDYVDTYGAKVKLNRGYSAKISTYVDGAGTISYHGYGISLLVNGRNVSPTQTLDGSGKTLSRYEYEITTQGRNIVTWSFYNSIYSSYYTRTFQFDNVQWVASQTDLPPIVFEDENGNTGETVEKPTQEVTDYIIGLIKKNPPSSEEPIKMTKKQAELAHLFKVRELPEEQIKINISEIKFVINDDGLYVPQITLKPQANGKSLVYDDTLAQSLNVTMQMSTDFKNWYNVSKIKTKFKSGEDSKNLVHNENLTGSNSVAYRAIVGGEEKQLITPTELKKIEMQSAPTKN